MHPEAAPSRDGSASTIVPLAPVRDMAAAARALTEAMDRHLAEVDRGSGAFLRIEQPLQEATPVPPLVWLSRRPHPQRLCFETDDGRASLAGIGFAAVARGGIDEVRALVSRLAAEPAGSPLRFLLTDRFDNREAADPTWAAFGGTTLMLPLVELRREDERTVLAINLDLSADDTDARAEEAARILKTGEPAAEPTAAFRATRVAEEPDAPTWKHAIDATLADISAGRLAKCVLARTRTYALEGSLDPFALLQHAAEAQPGTFRFGIQVEGDRTFIGATPEVLFRRQGGAVQSDALAGTRVRGNGAKEDAVLGDELMASAKDREEHEIVRQHIEAALAPLCQGELCFEGPRLRRLTDVQHLDTSVRGELVPDATDADLLGGLHPTPAVCGVPAQAAREAIASREPFDRGLYTGAVGLVGRDEAIVTVGIRSALHLGDRVTLLAGAGIVAGSEAEREWDETSDKMSVLDGILRAGHDA